LVRHPHAITFALDGTLRGQYFTNSASPGSGTDYLVGGVNSIGGFGLASGVGGILTPGPGVEGYAQGHLSLLGGRGTLRLDLTALEPQTGSQSIAHDYSFRISGATGQFRGAVGSGGSATLTLIQGPRSRFGYPRILQRFALSLKSDPPAS
jgi:hypothetical protein